MCESVQKQKIFIRYFEGSRAHQFHLGYLVICITEVRGQSDAHVVRNVCVCVYVGDAMSTKEKTTIPI